MPTIGRCCGFCSRPSVRSRSGRGVTGVEMAIELEPDTVLIDIGLPASTANEVAQQIRAKLRGRLRLIALSGYGKRRTARVRGARRPLLKPVDPTLLQAVLMAPRTRR